MHVDTPTFIDYNKIIVLQISSIQNISAEWMKVYADCHDA